MNAKDTVRRALENGLVVPAFNVPYPPMLKPIAQAVADEDSVAMIQVARLEWEKFEAVSLERIAEEYAKYAVAGHTLLHLDHVPVIDEDHLEVDYIALIKRAIKAGYQSVMVDASRLDLAGNIAATRAVADLAHAAGIPVEAELGAVMGHETSQATIPYDEIFEKKLGFTEVADALAFVSGSGCDWLSVAVGSVHGAIADNLKDQKKPAARLDIDRIAEIRQPYERALRERNDVEYARECVYVRMRELIRDFLHTAGDGQVIGE